MGPWGRLVENLSSKLAFFPPQPSTYEVAEHKDGTGELYIKPLVQGIPRVLQCSVKIVKTVPVKGLGGGQQIVTAFCPFKQAGGSLAKITILYSHGNAVDLGQMLPVYRSATLHADFSSSHAHNPREPVILATTSPLNYYSLPSRELSRILKVNVMGYDYTGYGRSTGTPTVNHTLADIAAVMELLRSQYGIPNNQVIVYGQSVGSGPSVRMLGCTAPPMSIHASTAVIASLSLHSPVVIVILCGVEADGRAGAW